MILDELLKILNNIKNIDFILFYGSLLGYVRENDFIKNDDDIDILINIFDVQSLLRQLKNLNLDVTVFIELKVDNTYGKIGIIQVLLPNNKETLDFYIYEELDDNDIIIRWDGGLLFNKLDIFPLKKITFKNININIPNNSEKILDEVYGLNWKTPLLKTEYSWQNINTVRKNKDLSINRWAESKLT